MRWSLPREKKPRHLEASASHSGGRRLPFRPFCSCRSFLPSAWTCTAQAASVWRGMQHSMLKSSTPWHEPLWRAHQQAVALLQ